MSWEAAIAIGPCTTPERLDDPTWRTGADDRVMFDLNALTLMPRTVPAVINHDKGRELGRVKRLTRLDVGDPLGRWIVAIAELDRRPDWLRRGTPASFEMLAPRRCSIGWPIVRAGLVSEVTVCTSDFAPMEPAARVLYVTETKPDDVAPRSLLVREIARRRVDGALIIDMSDGTQEIHHPAGARPVTRFYENVPMVVR